MSDASTPAPILISVKGVGKSYTRGGETLHVLDGLDLEIPEGSFQALMGPSGSGKSTLMHILGLLHAPDPNHGPAPQLFLGGREVAGLSTRWVARYPRAQFETPAPLRGIAHLDGDVLLDARRIGVAVGHHDLHGSPATVHPGAVVARGAGLVAGGPGQFRISASDVPIQDNRQDGRPSQRRNRN